MPLGILEGEPPSPPAWGTLALDTYLLSEWDTPHPGLHLESPSDRRSRLIREFLALGSVGRQPYDLQTVDPPTPTDTQITEILRPSRPESLRPWLSTRDPWMKDCTKLRLCYDPGKEEAHESVWSGNLAHAFVGPDGILFDDKGIFGGVGMDLSRFLETFPERVTNMGFAEHVQHRESALRDALRRIQEDGEGNEPQGEEGYSEEFKRFLTERRSRDPLLRYWEYHAACVVTHLFIEDEETLDGKGLLHALLDDTGNIVRQWRTDDDGEDFDFDGSWKEGLWKGDFENGRGELGASYQEGGVKGPPYEL